MKLIDMITLRSNAQVMGLQPLGTTHPPSLKNPIPVKTPLPNSGWDPQATKQERQQAIADLIETLNRTMRQAGNPRGAQTALAPVRPVVEQ